MLLGRRHMSPRAWNEAVGASSLDFLVTEPAQT
jgi:hypothetical protein